MIKCRKVEEDLKIGLPYKKSLQERSEEIEKVIEQFVLMKE